MDGTQGLFDDLSASVDIRHHRLQNALLRSQEFQTTFDDFMHALTELERRLGDEQPLVARFQEISAQQQEHEVRYPYQMIFTILYENKAIATFGHHQQTTSKKIC